jgi:hypothetical protein
MLNAREAGFVPLPTGALDAVTAASQAPAFDPMGRAALAALASASRQRGSVSVPTLDGGATPLQYNPNADPRLQAQQAGRRQMLDQDSLAQQRAAQEQAFQAKRDAATFAQQQALAKQQAGYRMQEIGAQNQGDLAKTLAALSAKGTDPARAAQQENTLRDDYRSEPVIKNAAASKEAYVQVKTAYEAAKQPGMAGFADLQLIIGAAKMADPNSVVRTEEGEAVRQTPGLPQQIVAAWNHLRGQGSLTPKIRDSMMQFADQFARNKQALVRPVQAQYGALSRKYSADSALVARDPYEGVLPATPGGDTRKSLEVRVQELRAAGKSKEEARAILHQEGYE